MRSVLTKLTKKKKRPWRAIIACGALLAIICFLGADNSQLHGELVRAKAQSFRLYIENQQLAEIIGMLMGEPDGQEDEDEEKISL